jgi:hypothetical protein
VAQTLHRDTIRACLRVIAGCETLDQARTQLGRLLGSFDKLRGQGLSPDGALAEATSRIEQLGPPPRQPTPAPRPAPLTCVRGPGFSLGKALAEVIPPGKPLQPPPLADNAIPAQPTPAPQYADTQPIRRRRAPASP